MDGLFISILNMSINASWLILVVMLCRLLFKRSVVYLRKVLWLFVLLRLVCPFSFESVLSLIPSANTVPTDIGVSLSPEIASGIPLVDNVVNPLFVTPEPSNSANPLQILSFVAACIWIVVFIGIVLYGLFSYFILKFKLRDAVMKEENIFQSEKITTPFVLGFIKPKIYLPFNFSEQYVSFVVAHEKVHISHFDHILKFIAYVITAVHWFNPLVWLAYYLFCADIEFSCDSRVISKLSNAERKEYASALLECGVGKKRILASPVAFGETGIKARIKKVIKYKKPAVFIMIIAVLICIFVAACFLSNPPAKTETIKDFSGTFHYRPMLSATFHYYLSLDFDVEYEFIEATCDKGKLIDKDLPYPQKQSEGENLIYTNNRNVYWTPINTEFRQGEKALVCFSLKRNSGEIISGEVYIMADSDFNGSEQKFSIGFDCDDLVAYQEDNGLVIKLKDKAYLPGVSYSNYSAKFSRANAFKDGGLEKIMSYSEYAVPPKNSIKYLPIVKITSVKELEGFINEMSAYFSLDSKYDGQKSFKENMEKYSYDSFYQDKALYVVYVSEPSGSNRHKLSSLTIKNRQMNVEVLSVIPEMGTDDMADWFISFELDREYADSIDTYNVYNLPENYTANQNLNPSFVATVLEVYDGSILVQPDASSNEILSSDKIYVSTNVVTSNPVPVLKAGDIVSIVYDGTILESYPAQINSTISIFKEK